MMGRNLKATLRPCRLFTERQDRQNLPIHQPFWHIGKLNLTFRLQTCLQCAIRLILPTACHTEYSQRGSWFTFILSDYHMLHIIMPHGGCAKGLKQIICQMFPSGTHICKTPTVIKMLKADDPWKKYARIISYSHQRKIFWLSALIGQYICGHCNNVI